MATTPEIEDKMAAEVEYKMSGWQDGLSSTLLPNSLPRRKWPPLTFQTCLCLPDYQLCQHHHAVQLCQHLQVVNPWRCLLHQSYQPCFLFYVSIYTTVFFLYIQ